MDYEYEEKKKEIYKLKYIVFEIYTVQYIIYMISQNIFCLWMPTQKTID
jgi:hypothetical protein